MMANEKWSGVQYKCNENPELFDNPLIYFKVVIAILIYLYM